MARHDEILQLSGELANACQKATTAIFIDGQPKKLTNADLTQETVPKKITYCGITLYSSLPVGSWAWRSVKNRLSRGSPNSDQSAKSLKPSLTSIYQPATHLTRKLV